MDFSGCVVGGEEWVARGSVFPVVEWVESSVSIIGGLELELEKLLGGENASSISKTSRGLNE